MLHDNFRTSLDLKLKHGHMDKKSEHDLHARKLREKDRDLKYLIQPFFFTKKPARKSPFLYKLQ
jgi:hypothetical protein